MWPILTSVTTAVRYNRIAQTGVRVSSLGFGASPFGDIYRQAVSLAEARRALSLAQEAGITYIDVAPYYGLGLAEEKLGQALPAAFQKTAVLSTKVGRYGVDVFDFSPATITRSLETSLRRLKRSHIDMVFCHDIEFVDQALIVEQALPTLARLKEQGQVRAIGISGLPLDRLLAVASAFPVDVVLSYSCYTLLNQTLSAYLPRFEALGCSVINASPFAMGLLTEGHCPAWHPATAQEQQRAQTLIADARKQGDTIEARAFRFAYGCPGVASLLTGVASSEQLQQCVSWLASSEDSTAANGVS